MDTSPLRRALSTLANHQSLTESETDEVFGVVMAGEASPAQIAALLMGLRAKGETADEVAGAARALRAAMLPVGATGPNLVDTCGTGGGTVPTFNISTVAAFVAAGAGATVPKHGNRSFTSKCGSADVLEALGVRIVLDAPTATRVLKEARVAFLFAPNFHPAMKHVAPVRRELGVPSVMNLVKEHLSPRVIFLDFWSPIAVTGDQLPAEFDAQAQFDFSLFSLSLAGAQKRDGVGKMRRRLLVR